MTIGPATVVNIAEHNEPPPATVTDGITLFNTPRAPRLGCHDPGAVGARKQVPWAVVREPEGGRFTPIG